MTGAAICYHSESYQAGGGESCSPESRMDILMPSFRAVPHLSSSHGFCKPTDEYPHSALRGSSWGRDQWGCCQQNHWSWCFLMAQPPKWGPHSQWADSDNTSTSTSVRVCTCTCIAWMCPCVCVRAHRQPHRHDILFWYHQFRWSQHLEAMLSQWQAWSTYMHIFAL